MGLLDQFLPEDAETRQGLSTGIGALGLALASSPGNAPFQNLPQAMAIMGQQQKAGTSRSALKALLMQAGYTDAEANQLSSSEGVAKLAIQQKQQQKILGDGADAEPSLFGGGGTGAVPAISPAAPAGPAAGASLNGGIGGLSGSQAEKAQAWYSEAIKQGATPLEAAAMVGNFTVENGLNTTGKPGDNGTAFGGGQWREERAANLRKLAQDRGESWDSVPVQVAHTLNELKGGDAGAARARALIAQAKTPEEAAGIFAQHFERPSKDALAATLGQRAGAAAQAYKMFGQGIAPTRVADASGVIPIGAPGRPAGVQIADNEQQTQALEGRMGMYPPNVYGITPETQARATSLADMPAVDAQPAGFVIPPGAQASVEKQVGTPPTPVNPNIGPTTQRAQAIANFNYWGKRLRASAALGEAGKGLMEEAKIKMNLASEYLKPTDAEKLADAAGLTGATRSEILSGAIPGAAPTSLQKDYKSYRQQEISEGRLPLSQIEYDTKLRTAGKTDINIRNDAEKKEEVGRAESVTKFLGGIADSAPATAKRAASLDQLGRLISRTATAQGTTLKAQLDGIGKELGLSTGELKTKADAINAIVNSLAPQMREPGTGTVSDADLRGFLAALPSLSATPEGNQLILGGLKRATDVDRERTKIAAQWQAGKLTAAEARSKIAEIDERSIYSSEAERSLVTGLSPIPENKARAGWRVLGVE